MQRVPSAASSGLKIADGAAERDAEDAHTCNSTATRGSSLAAIAAASAARRHPDPEVEHARTVTRLRACRVPRPGRPDRRFPELAGASFRPVSVAGRARMNLAADAGGAAVEVDGRGRRRLRPAPKGARRGCRGRRRRRRVDLGSRAEVLLAGGLPLRERHIAPVEVWGPAHPPVGGARAVRGRGWRLHRHGATRSARVVGELVRDVADDAWPRARGLRIGDARRAAAARGRRPGRRAPRARPGDGIHFGVDRDDLQVRRWSYRRARSCPTPASRDGSLVGHAARPRVELGHERGHRGTIEAR